MNNQYTLRDVIGEYILELGRCNDKVIIVNADLSGTCRTKDFTQFFPDRSFNVGIAEQNMISFSAGLAHEGFIPYAFSMASFISMRACEQCRTDVAYADLPVRLIATYAGCSGGISGATHWALEDCGIMCSMPNMVVLEPSDAVQAKRMLDFSLSYAKPMYMRTSIISTEDIYNEDYYYSFATASFPKDGKDASFICSGVTVRYAIKAAKIIDNTYGLKIQVIDMHTIKPIDKRAIIAAARKGPILVAHDHNIIGGLGSEVARVLAEAGISAKFKILGIPDTFYPCAHAEYLYRAFSYDVDGLVGEMERLLELK